MAILDLNGSKPLQNPEGKRLFRRAQRRDLQLPAGVLGLAGPGGFAAAKYNRLTGDFTPGSRSADQDLFADNIVLRARARKLALDNPHARKFLQICSQNIVGSSGILLQAKVSGLNGKKTAATDVINKRIEEEWRRWCERGSCTADGRLSMVDVQHQVVKNWAREGENLTKWAYGRQFNDTGIALQLLDNDQLDDTYTRPLETGGEVRLGVEVDPFRRPLGYWLYNGHPNDPLTMKERQRFRVDAKDIIHTAVFDRPGQTRGYTQMAAAILDLNQYGRYREAVVVAARASAAKFAVIQQQAAEGWSPDDEDIEGDDRNFDGTEMMTANAGEIPRLDPGETLNFTDPRFPTNNHEPFSRSMLRDIASGLLVSYPMFANDMAQVNFSSIRASLVDERDCWRVLQHWFIDNFLRPVFYGWLNMALLTTLSDITLSKDQMRQFHWRARGFEWVDPLKDADAVVLKRGNGLTTYTRELANQGLDFEETIDEIARENEYLKEKDVVLGTDITGDQGGKGVAAGDESAAATAAGGQAKQGGKGK